MRAVDLATRWRSACGLVAGGLAALVMGSAVSAAGCKGGEGESPSSQAPEIVAKQAELGSKEEELLKRRDALLNTRMQLRTKRAELVEKQESVRASGGDVSALQQEAQELLDEEKSLVGEEQDLNSQLDRLLSDRRALISAMTTGASDAAGIAGREAALASREKDLARREQQVAQREAQVSSREEGLAAKWKESCSGVGTTTTIVQTVDAKGSQYTKKDVDPLLTRARNEMQKRGILKSDLPEPVRDLEREATAAMAEGDYGKARFAATQLLATVRNTRVDKAFIAAKISRLNGMIKNKQLSDSVETLFRQATESVADGKFADANRNLNRIYAQLN